MNLINAKKAKRLVIGPNDGLGRLRVRTEAYCRLDLRLSEWLQDLEDVWARLASPGRGGARRRSPAQCHLLSVD